MTPFFIILLVLYLGIGGAVLSSLGRGDLHEWSDGEEIERNLLYNKLKEDLSEALLMIFMCVTLWPLVLYIILDQNKEIRKKRENNE